VWVPQGVISPARKPAPAWAPLPTGPQVLAGLLTGSQPPSGIHLLHHGPPRTEGEQPASPWSFITSCKGRVSAPASQAPPPPSFFTDLGVCRAVSFTSSHSSLLTALLSHLFFPFLNMLSQRRYPTAVADWFGLGQRRVCLTAGWHWLYQTWGKLLTEATPIAPPLLKPCHTNP